MRHSLKVVKLTQRRRKGVDRPSGKGTDDVSGAIAEGTWRKIKTVLLEENAAIIARGSDIFLSVATVKTTA